MRFKLLILKYWLGILLIPKFESRGDIEKYQSKKLFKYSAKILTKSSYYKNFFVNALFDWNSVSQITKKEFMDNFDEINTLGILKSEAMKVALEAEESRDFKSEINGITVGLSTGTSGKRGLFLVSEKERAQWVAIVMTRVIKPKLFKKQKVAFFLRANSNLYSSVESGLFEFKYFDIFKPINELLDDLNSYQPDILASQPSVLVDIALAQKQGDINICPAQVISFAEVLHRNDRKGIESVFKVKITEIYQCTEGFLGVSCKHGTMHLNEDFVKVEKEWITNNKFYPIITDFSRSSQPVVKYKMNDVLQVREEPCPCGSHLLAIDKIIGRDDDVLVFNNIKVYPDLISRRIAQHTDEFQKYTIVQVSKNSLNIGIECNGTKFAELSNSFKTILMQLFKEYGVEDVQINFQNEIDHIPGNKTRKIRRV